MFRKKHKMAARRIAKRFPTYFYTQVFLYYDTINHVVVKTRIFETPCLNTLLFRNFTITLILIDRRPDRKREQIVLPACHVCIDKEANRI